MNTTAEIPQTWAGHIRGSGTITLPEEVCRVTGWKSGDDVVIEWDGHSVRMLSAADFTQETQQCFGTWQPGEPLWSDELIAERRAEAARECDL